MLRPYRFSLGLLFISVGWAADAAPDSTKTQETNAFPPGMIAMFAGSSCPDGWTDEPLTQGRIAIGATTRKD